MLFGALCLLSLAITSTQAAPPRATKGSAGAGASAGLTPLSKQEIARFRPFTYYTKAAYCGVATKKKWDCGESCAKTNKFKLVDSGGDGNNTQFWFVGYDPDLKTVIVSHQGTDPEQSGSVAIDLDTTLVAMDKTLFPKADKKVLVHHGFSAAHARAAPSVLAAVQKTLKSNNGTKKVTLVGHSLGAALSLLDALYLPLHIPNVEFSFIGYGMPRVGNKDFAKFVDTSLPHLDRINNKQDPVPTLPTLAMKYSHPSGEIHITDDNKWIRCPGQDNESPQCSTGAVTFLDLVSSRADHSGPFDGISFAKC